MNIAQPARRIGIIGDVHAEDTRLRLAIDILKAEGVCNILCTGDLVDGRGCPEATIDLLRNNDIQTVRGNHDRWLLQEKARHVPNAHFAASMSEDSLDYLRNLPRQVVVQTIKGPLLLCHGVGKNDLRKVWPGTERMAPETSPELDQLIEGGAFRWVINGHMHFQTLIRFESLTLINGGSLAGKRWPGFSILDLEHEKIDTFGFAGSEVFVGKTTHIGDHTPGWRNTQCFSGGWKPVLLFDL